MSENRVQILKRANKLFQQGKSDAAVKEYRKLLVLKSDDLEVRRIIGDIELRQNNIPEAISEFEWIADYYLKEGFFAKAIAMYKRITRVDPNYEGALYKLADLYTKQGLIMEAKQIYLDIAEECKRQNNQKKALDMYKKILEFDKTNVKMRLLLADNYLKEGMESTAVNEYLASADILISKKDILRAEELLLGTIKVIKDIKLIEKLLFLYTKQEEDDKAIALLQELGLDVFKNVELLKILGELYLKKNQMGEAEIVFSKIAEIDPDETEVILRLGKVYLQREDYDKTFNLFLPIIDKNIENAKFEEGASLLRLIIASNNSYLPALTKLSAIFKLSGKTNNLIALYESLIPIYEQKGLTEELKRILEELIQLSDSPFNYEEQLARLNGKVTREAEPEIDNEGDREKEFVNFNIRMVEEALRTSDFNRAMDILKKSKSTFPRNIDIRKKMFETYQRMDEIDLAVEEGKSLLELYKFLNFNEEHSDLLAELSMLKPDDVKVVELSNEERTSIEIDFDHAALIEEVSDVQMDMGAPDDSDVLLLSQEESINQPNLVTPSSSNTKSLSSVLSEVDFYVNDGYYGDAERLLSELKLKYPGNQALLAKIEKLEKAKRDARRREETVGKGTVMGFEIEGSAGEDLMVMNKEKTSSSFNPVVPQQSMLYQTEENQQLEIDIDESDSFQDLKLSPTDSGQANEPILFDMELDKPLIPPKNEDFFELEPSFAQPDLNYPTEPIQPIEPIKPLELDEFQNHKSNPDWEDSSMLKISEHAYASSDNSEDLSFEAYDDDHFPMSDGEDLFEIESSISEESHHAQKYEDSKVDMKIDPYSKSSSEIKIKQDAFNQDESEMAFEIELDEVQDSSPNIQLAEIDKDLLIQSPSVSPTPQKPKEKAFDGYSSSVTDELDLDSIIMNEDSVYDLDSPFKEMSGTDIGFDSDEDLLNDEVMFLEESFLEIEKNVSEELEAIGFWLKELEKQRTSTIEKNMMEIFEEFKKGVDEKIGKEDYDTRYNLGIAYKEMGLLEEAIHEFLISSKHPLKFFDSAGLLGMCFREKGMFGEASNWFEKALQTPDRRQEEYLAVKYELVLTLKLKEEYKTAKQLLEDIIRITPDYRNVVQLYQEIKAIMTQK